MKKYTDDSFEYDTSKGTYSYMLLCDDINGIIRMSFIPKPKKSTTIRLTRRAIPITYEEHFSFSKDKTGYYNGNVGDPFKGSWIGKKENLSTYNKWLHFMYNRYHLLKTQTVGYTQLSLFDAVGDWDEA